MVGYLDSISSSYALASNGYGALPISEEMERIRSPSLRCRLRFEHLRMSIIASAADTKPNISSSTSDMVINLPPKMTTTTPSGKSLLEGNMILALFAMLTGLGADVAAGPTGLGVDETGMVVKIVEGPALLKIVLEALPCQPHLY
jgi:hypothetical protein